MNKIQEVHLPIEKAKINKDVIALHMQSFIQDGEHSIKGKEQSPQIVTVS